MPNTSLSAQQSAPQSRSAPADNAHHSNVQVWVGFGVVVSAVHRHLQCAHDWSREKTRWRAFRVLISASVRSYSPRPPAQNTVSIVLCHATLVCKRRPAVPVMSETVNGSRSSQPTHMSTCTKLDRVLTMAWTPVEFRKSITYVSARSTQHRDFKVYIEMPM
jgi:hypothetical protein